MGGFLLVSGRAVLVRWVAARPPLPKVSICLVPSHARCVPSLILLAPVETGAKRAVGPEDPASLTFPVGQRGGILGMFHCGSATLGMVTMGMVNGNHPIWRMPPSCCRLTEAASSGIGLAAEVEMVFGSPKPPWSMGGLKTWPKVDNAEPESNMLARQMMKHFEFLIFYILVTNPFQGGEVCQNLTDLSR